MERKLTEETYETAGTHGYEWSPPSRGSSRGPHRVWSSRSPPPWGSPLWAQLRCPKVPRQFCRSRRTWLVISFLLDLFRKRDSRLQGLVILFVAWLGGKTLAQKVIRETEYLASIRSEVWAMNHFTSVMLIAGLSVPRRRIRFNGRLGMTPIRKRCLCLEAKDPSETAGWLYNGKS